MNRLRPYLTWRALVVAVVALLVVALGAVFGPLAVAGPQVTSITPADGAADANPQAGIRVEFNQWVRADSVAGAVRLDPPSEFTVVPAEAPRPWRSAVLIQPQGGLQYGTQYRLSLDGSAKNLLGRSLGQPLAIEFATVPYIAVKQLGPQQDAAQVPLRSPITVEFEAPVVAADLIAAAAQDPAFADTLPQPLTLAPAARGVGRWLSPTLYGFYPEAPLHAATSYTATVSVDISPDGKWRLERPVAWRFSTEAPLLVGVRPYDGAVEVPADGAVEVRLAPDVDVVSAGAHFSLYLAGSGAQVQGTVETVDGGFHFKPAAALDRGARYQARIDRGVNTTTGAPLNPQPLTWSFTVMGDLEVVQVEPLADTLEVLTDTNRISVRFNHPVVALTQIDAQDTLPQPLQIDPPLQGTGRWIDTSTYIYSPAAGLLPSTSYRVRVADGLLDQTGGALRQEFAWSFSTITPQVVGSIPAPGDQYASPFEPIQVVFNQPMDPAGLRGAIRLQRDGADIPGSIRIVGSSVATLTDVAARAAGKELSVPRIPGFVVTFTPDTPLERGGNYMLTVAQGVAAAQGSGVLSFEYTSPFYVAPLPRLYGSDPADGAGAAELAGSVRLNFSTPMDWDSVQRNLVIEPKPTEIYSNTNQAELYLFFSLLPETDYRVTVGGAAQDPYGVALGQDAVVSFHTASLPPALAFVGTYRLGAYNAYVPARVPIQTVNVPSVSYDLYRLDRDQVPPLTTLYDGWVGFQPDPSALVKGDVVALQGERNRGRIDLLDLGRIDAGTYMLEVRGLGIIERQIMVVSPYALTVKRGVDTLFVWAVDLATGKPVADLPLVASSYAYEPKDTVEPLDIGVTDAEGVLKASFSTPNPYDALFVWSADDRFAFTTTNWGEGISPWDFGLSADYARSPIVGSVYTDRPIYRPEQNVYIRGALRMANGERYELPSAGQRIDLTVNDPEGSTIFSTTLALSEFGTFNSSLALAQGARLGSYGVSVRFAGADAEAQASAPTIYGSFTVAEYRKPTFEIQVTPALPDLIQGDTLEMTVSARYFSGGALANAPVRWRLLANPLYFGPESAPNFRFEDLDDAYEWYRWFDNQAHFGGESVGDGEGRTDAQGRFTLKLPADLGKDGHSRTLTLDVEITDVDGQVIAGQGTANVHAGAFYIGLRPEGYVAQAGQPQQVALLTLDPQGRPEGGRSLEVGVYKREWFSAREQGADGRFYFTSHYTDTLVENLQATTDAQGRAGISFTPKEGGSYRIGAEGRDDAGHTIKASAFTWAYGGEVFWGVNDTNRIDLIADKDRYKPGDTAGILVTAPYPGMTALVTIERGEVLEHRLMTLKGTTELLQVPITAEHAPNIYVSAVLVKPAGDDVPVPDLRVGLVNLPVSTEQQELTISVTPDKAEAGPRDEITYTVKATDYAGKGVRAEVSLALVDKAVLSLADDPNPTFKQAFYEKRPLGVFTASSLTALVDRVTLKLQPGDKGGGGGLAAEVLVRRDFPDTAYWNPTLVTGEDGTATVTLRLPDNLTTWRMTARGLTADTLVGQSTADLVATRPLLVRPALPRFLTVGDELTLQSVVHNNTPNPIDATISLAVAGDGEAPAPLQLGAQLEQQVQVPANGTAVLRWPAVVGGPAGGPVSPLARLTFTVKGGGHEDIVEQALPVQRYLTPETVASAGQVRDTPVIETLQVPDGREGQVNLELVPSLAAGVETGLDYLEHYPYLCSEQTVSRFLPNAVTYRLFKQLGMDDPKLRASLETNLGAGLQRLYTMQHLDGGWGWWDDESHPYLTAYVVQGLVEARKAGYGVDQAVLDNGIDYLQSFLNGELNIENGELGTASSTLNSRAYVLFVLAEAGQPDSGRTIALFEQRAKLDIYGRAYLLMTLKALGAGHESRVRTLAAELMGTAILRTADAHWEERAADYWTMSTNTRTTALALQALVRADPDNFLVPNAVRYLMSLRENGHWRTTQETAVTLMALAEYIAQSGELEADYSYRAALDGTTLREGAVNRDNLKDPASVVIALADLKAGGASQIELQRQAAGGQSGEGRLYYTLRMRYYEDAAAVQPLDQGLAVQRAYVAVDTTTLTPTGQLVSQVKVGDVVQVRLTLTVPEHVHYLAVEDMLPAGLEPIDSSLKTVSAVAQDPALAEAGGEMPYWWYFTRTEIRDNRVALFATDLSKGTYHYTYLARATTAGTFQTLPALAYQMYAPEVFGRTAGAEFVVTEQ